MSKPSQPIEIGDGLNSFFAGDVKGRTDGLSFFASNFFASSGSVALDAPQIVVGKIVVGTPHRRQATANFSARNFGDVKRRGVL